MKSLGAIEFGQLLTDQPGYNNRGVKVAEGLLPALVGFRPLPSLEPLTFDGMDSTALGGVGLRDDIANIPYVYTGDAGKLYWITSGAFLNVSVGADAVPTAAPYSDKADHWSFQQWENEVYATNGIDALQFIIAGGLEFAPAILTPVAEIDQPKGQRLAIVREFLVMADITQGIGDIRHTDRVQWSGFNEPTFWGIDQTKLADFQDLRGAGGAIKALTSGSESVIFQERNIWRMTFVGAPQIFRFDIAEESVGTSAPGSVVRYQDDVYFLSGSGFRKINVRSGKSIQIGEERIDELLLRNLNQSALHAVSSEIWKEHSCVVWAVPTAGETPDFMFIYNYAADRWTTAKVSVDLILQVSRPAATIEDLQQLFSKPPVAQEPPPADEGTGNLEDIPGSLDDPLWAGGPFQFGAIDSAHFGATFSGVPGSSRVATGESPIPGRGMVTYVRPLVAGVHSFPDTTVSLRVGHRANESDALTWTPEIPMNSDGVCPVRAEGRYLRVELFIEGGFNDLVGVEPYGGSTGVR